MGDVLADLAATIRSRRTATADKSYTRKLLDGGAGKCARKFGEEALEAVIAGVSGSDEELKSEAADVLFHLLVLLEARGLGLDDALAVLRARTGVSGIDEKASRGKQD